MAADPADLLSEPMPCTDCPWQARCAAQQLACTAFEKFAHGHTWTFAPRTDATHERYVRLMGDEPASTHDIVRTLLT